jgi:hypothetical protein
MEKLTLEHLAGYLPYQLKMMFEKSGRIITLDGIKLTDSSNLIYAEGERHFEATIWNFKPLLRPLSDLTKEIEHNGEKFFPIKKIQIYGDENYLIEQIKIGLVEQIVYQMLLKWHFDVHRLIDKNLAIPITEK